MAHILEELKEIAKNDKIPIMTDDTIEFITQYIKDNNIKDILEIGTAYGFSAINMALVNEDIRIDTIERDELRFNKANEFITKLNLTKRINTNLIDAFEYIPDKKYDLIIFDGAKSQNIKFFNKFSPYLNEDSTIITDNLSFHGLVDSNIKMSRNLRQMTRKINDYIVFLKDNNKYKTIFYEIGDTISVTKKRSDL